MTEERRHSQASARSDDPRLDGNTVLFSCFRCGRYKFPKCAETGEDIPYPVSGPIGEKCPLPKYEKAD